MYLTIIREYENKLKELMSEKEFAKFAKEVAKKSFKADVDSMEDGEFKNFVLDNFNKITR